LVAAANVNDSPLLIELVSVAATLAPAVAVVVA
jgi:hypothetical protein